MFSHFYKALDSNILLTDIFNVYNSAITDLGELKYFDLDGIKYFESKEEMLASIEYKNAIGIIKEIEQYENFFNKT